jgi:hypothetical protein
MPTEVMLDLETLGSGPRAAVVQIGACTFDPETGTGDADFPPQQRWFFRNIRFRSAMRYGEADGDTVAWWLQQNDEARLGLLSDPIDLPAALSAFAEWWATLGKVNGLWSHATFDAVILQSAYDSCTKWCPWRHRQVRDLRTLQSLYWPGKRERDGVHHNALDDAIFQAQLARDSLRTIRAGLA